MKKILYNLGLFLIGISIYLISVDWIDWTFTGVIQRSVFFILGFLLIFTTEKTITK